MTPSDFNQCMGALTDYYGDRAFPPRTKDILFRLLIGLQKTELLRIIDLVAEEHSRAPAIAAIKKTALPFLRDSEQRRMRIEVERLEEMREGRCLYCDFTGYVLVLSRKDPTIEYSFRCPSCPAVKVRRIDERIQLWADELREFYIPISFRNESHEAARKIQRQAYTEKITKRRGKVLAPANVELAQFAEGLAAQIVGGTNEGI